jgi:hypothetical protein
LCLVHTAFACEEGAVAEEPRERPLMYCPRASQKLGDANEFA